jgi:uncharacterized protein YicC (UPF0701 family)
VDAGFYARPAPGSARELALDDELLDRVIENAVAVQRRLGGSGYIDAVDLLRWPGVMRETERDSAALAASAMDLLAEALAAFTASRAAEGERIAQMLASRGNPERLEQEIAILVQKMDVAEELDRLRSHVEELGTTLASGEAVGRKLDFLMQEFNREANTLSSKSQDVETTRKAVELKVLIEQMREQIQNVE